MRAFSIASAIALSCAAACAPDRPSSVAEIHPSSTTAPRAALNGADPHVVVREATPSAYCLACHVGLDKSGHPLGVSLVAAAASRPGAFFLPPADPAVVLVGGATVECASCHDDGTAGFPFRTVSADLCVACHDKSFDPPAVDVTSPRVTFTFVGNQTPLRLDALINFFASDDVGVVRTELWAGSSPEAPDKLLFSSGPTALGMASFYLDTRQLPDGTSYLVARAYDHAGNAGSAVTAIVVDNTPPAVAITSPAYDAKVRGPTTVTVEASDNMKLASVSIYVDQTLLATFTEPPFVATWYPVRKTGLHGIGVCATDSAGNHAVMGIPVHAK